MRLPSTGNTIVLRALFGVLTLALSGGLAQAWPDDLRVGVDYTHADCFNSAGDPICNVTDPAKYCTMNNDQVTGYDILVPAVVVGNDGDDTIIGSTSVYKHYKDRLYGDDGDDNIYGFRGSDAIYGGDDDDPLF
jgi:Ca2+-binding RTX toxin-like protein